MSEHILGFQLRVNPRVNPDQSWDRSRRQAYLLNPEISYPLSVDDVVWFRLDDDDLASVVFCDYSSDESSSPNSLDLCSLSEQWREHVIARTDATLIAISASKLDARELARQHGFPLEGPHFPLENDDWLLLGFDVADTWLLSGLTNCGYREDEIDRIRHDFSGRLNENGLFRERDAAKKFCELSNSRIPEHAPFYCFGLYAFVP